MERNIHGNGVFPIELLLLTVNIVLPLFLMMATGYAFRRAGLVDARLIKGMNKLVFQLFLPLSLMQSLLRVQPDSVASPKVLLYGLFGTIAVAAVSAAVVPRFVSENARRGVIIQGLFRSNYAIFGIPLSEAIFPQGDGGVAAMMVMATIPIYNILGVIVLETYRGGRVDVLKILKGILKNPLLWGCVAGFTLMECRVTLPSSLTSVITKFGQVASPLALFCLGGTIDIKALGRNRRSLTFMSFMRLIGVPAVMLAVAYAMGFRGVEFAVLMIAFGSPCAVSSYTMAAQMDGDAELAGQQVMITTVLSSLSMFLMIYLFKGVGIF
ncbi:MAG: AEC family transporter [Clostridiales bacterium]|nr:AEC family transporter [Clostridiales bacterium]